MTDRAIAVGDMVQVVKPQLCGCDQTLGNTFSVEEIAPAKAGALCVYCGRATYSAGTLRVPHPDGGFTELSRLKRLPPLDEPAETYTTETHKEPA